MSKQNLIGKSLTVFCGNVHSGKFVYVHGCESHHELMFKKKVKFIKLIENGGWRYIGDNWYCPPCSRAKS